MKSFALPVALALYTVLVAGSSLAQTATTVNYNYAKLNYPGASSTSPAWINNSNEVVGTYTDSAQNTHGFKWQNGTFTNIDFPGATFTYPSGVNDSGIIVGTYLLGSATHGFKFQNGAFTTIDFPGSVGSSGAIGINNAGTIVGNYGNSQGYVLTNGTFKTLDAPQLNPGGEPIDTELTGITNLGWITGRVFTGDFWRGFWYVNGEFDFLEKPFSLDNTVSGANGHGDIVGQGGSASCYISYAVETNEGSESTEKFPSLQPLNLPQGADCPTSINYNRVIVGSSYLGTPASTTALTLKVTSPTNNSTNTNPVHIVASASGPNPISQIQVWVNYKEVFHVSGGSLNANVTLPVGNNERFVVQALDSKGATAKVVETITVK